MGRGGWGDERRPQATLALPSRYPRATPHYKPTLALRGEGMVSVLAITFAGSSVVEAASVVGGAPVAGAEPIHCWRSRCAPACLAGESDCGGDAKET